jgi:hypothetical protein
MTGPVEHADVAVLGGGPGGYVEAPRATADDLAWTTHANLTLPLAMPETALAFGGAAIHVQAR